nr:MAG: ORF1 [TTV-like mini virus]
MARYYYRRRWRPRYRKRYRPFWTWRARSTFRTRRRRRRPRVRRKKRFLKLIQWQPKYINRLCIKGLYCLMQVHRAFYNHNYNQYAVNITREGLANGGGFTILRFTLNSLFEEHQKARNYWTKSNKNMPLFRYTGCTIKVYRPQDIDLVIRFQTCYPMCCSKLMYTGTQPSMLMMSRGSKIIRCKRNNPNLKPYKKFKFKPPDQMSNKWYFQHNESNTGLLLIQAASASLDNYYSSSNSESSTITLHGINTRVFQNLNFQTKSTYGYNPKENMYLWTAFDSDTAGSLVYLGQTQLYNTGQQIKDERKSTFQENLKCYMQNPKHWGNPFHQHHINKQEQHYYFTTTPPLQAFQNHTDITDTTPIDTLKSKNILHDFTQEILLKYRYNPFNDKGFNTIYALPNFRDNIVGNKFNLEPDDDPDMQNPGFPNWLGPFGFQDYLIKLGKKSRINTDYIFIIKSNCIQPQETYYMLIDQYFQQGNSELLIGRTDYDNTHWFPMIVHQQGAMNLLTLSAPGAPKLGETKLAEAKIEYQFYFKVGGCAPPIEKVKDPTEQPTYVTPTNLLDTNSLQSPEESIESFLYQFDWRRDQITDSATKRISKDFSTTKYLFPDTRSLGTQVPTLQTYKEELQSSEEEETQKETLFEQLQRQRLKQKDLRLRIKHLLTQIQSLE